MKKHLIVAVLALLLFLSATVTYSALEYKVRDLGWIGSNYSEVAAFATTDSDMILGSGVSGQDNKTYFAVWDKDGNLTALERIGTSSEASDINSSGTIVGYADMSSNDYYAVVWDATGAVTRTIGPGSANAINDTGQILLYDMSGYLVLNPDGTSYGLNNIPGYRSSSPSSLNSNGWAAGRTRDMVGYNYYPAIWDSQGNGSILSMPVGFTDSSVCAINDAGQVVGSVSDPVQVSAVIWNTSGMPSLLPHLDGYNRSYAQDINNAGWVAGGASSSFSQPVVWDESGNVSALPLLQGGSYGSAYAINNNGLIVGYSSDETGCMRAVLWTPIPEPSSLLAVGSGAIALAAVVRRRRK